MIDNLKLGQGQKMYRNLAGGEDTIERLKELYESGRNPEAISGLRLFYMASEVGLEDVPLNVLRQFADLVRADYMSEQLARALDVFRPPVPVSL